MPKKEKEPKREVEIISTKYVTRVSHFTKEQPKRGVYHVSRCRYEDNGEEFEVSVLVCSPELQILAMARDEHDDYWGYHARWTDLDGNKEHELTIPAGDLEGDPLKVRRRLLDGGMSYLAPGTYTYDPVITYIRSDKPKPRCRIVSSPGWFKPPGRDAPLYVLPDGDVVGVRNKERVVLRNDDAQSRIRHRQIAGTLEEWQHVSPFPVRETPSSNIPCASPLPVPCSR
jgi:hypothetical protein